MNSRRKKRPIPGLGMYSPFLLHVNAARRAPEGSAERLAICQLLRQRGPSVAEVRQSSELFRSGGPACYAKATLPLIFGSGSVQVDEIADAMPVATSGISKLMYDADCTKSFNLNVLLGAMLISGFPVARLPELPSPRLWLVAGLCRVTPRIVTLMGGK